MHGSTSQQVSMGKTGAEEVGEYPYVGLSHVVTMATRQFMNFDSLQRHATPSQQRIRFVQLRRREICSSKEVYPTAIRSKEISSARNSAEFAQTVAAGFIISSEKAESERDIDFEQFLFEGISVCDCLI